MESAYALNLQHIIQAEPIFYLKTSVLPQTIADEEIIRLGDEEK